MSSHYMWVVERGGSNVDGINGRGTVVARRTWSEMGDTYVDMVVDWE